MVTIYFRNETCLHLADIITLYLRHCCIVKYYLNKRTRTAFICGILKCCNVAGNVSVLAKPCLPCIDINILTRSPSVINK